MNIVYGNQEKIDFATTLVNVKKVDTLDKKIIDAVSDQTVLFSDSTEIVNLLSESYTEFVPYRNIPENYLDRDRLFTYFELELYPFFEKVKEAIGENKKGVLRFRRNISKGESETFIIEDLFVMARLLGNPEHVQVTHSKREVEPGYIIITVNFGQGTMAHMEYALSGKERLELEWSGVESIIEFDSEEMSPISPKQPTSLFLTYSIDAILKGAHVVDAEFVAQLEKWKELVKGGTE